MKETKKEENKVTIGTLLKTRMALLQLQTKDIPMGMAMDISSFIKKCNPEMMAYDDVRKKLDEKYGEPIKDKDKKDTGKFKPPTQESKNWAKYEAELIELQEKEIDVKVPIIKSERLKKIPTFNISIADLHALEWLIK